MIPKRKELPPPENIPLLETVKKEKIEFIFRRERRRRQFYGIYFFTMLVAIVLCVTVLFFGTDAFETVSRLFSKDKAEDSQNDEKDENGNEVLDGFLLPGVQTDFSNNESDTAKPSDGNTDGQKPPLTIQTLYQFNYNAVPNGEIPIIPMDLSLTSYGAAYIYNSTGLKPNTEAMLERAWGNDSSVEYLTAASAPLVLVVHTHGTEGYSKDGAISYREDTDSELARSTDPNETVVAVGKELSNALNSAGIPSLHCTVMHDREQYKDSYARAEETIKQYLERYPSIRLVIDVHRDSVVKSTGELVRPVTLVDGQAAAQVMCVVGSDWGGEENPNWEGNLALALQLRERLNTKCERLCRPVYLRSSTYNQELAPYSLLLEIGASGNSLEEALRSVRFIAEALEAFVPNL